MTPTDTFDPETRSWIMGRVKSTGTTPELKVRRAVHAAGFRYRLHRKDLPGAPDLVFPRFRLAVFVHGCFWHWHGCKRSRMPAANRDYWTAKIDRNVARDRVNQDKLAALGWAVRVIWECELPAGVETLLADLGARRETAVLPDARPKTCYSVVKTCDTDDRQHRGAGRREME